MSWICPKCETENCDRLNTCEVCNSPRVVKKNTVRAIPLESKDSSCDWRFNQYIRLNGMTVMVSDSDVESFDWEKICQEDSIPISNPFFTSSLKREAEKGNKDAQMVLARCFVRGLGVKKNINDAVVWFKRAAEGGNKSAQFILEEKNRKSTYSESNSGCSFVFSIVLLIIALVAIL